MLDSDLASVDDLASALGYVSASEAPSQFPNYVRGCDAMIVLNFGEHPSADVAEEGMPTDAEKANLRERAVRHMVLLQLVDLSMRAVAVREIQGVGVRIEFARSFRESQIEIMSQLRDWLER